MSSFAISTKSLEESRLTRDHLREMAAAGWDRLELRATRSHFDFHNVTAVADLQGWLAESAVTLHTVHAPVAEALINGRYVNRLNLAAAETEPRLMAEREAERALQIARRLPFEVLVVHLGMPRASAGVGDASKDGARRSLETLVAAAKPLGVRIAVEIISNDLSKPESLVHFLEDVIESTDAGICLDTGHAHLDGDVVDAIETVAEHLLAVEASDNRGRHDDHLLPFEGTIDWPAALTTLQKVGYEGTITLEPAARGTWKETLALAQRARQRMASYLEV